VCDLCERDPPHFGGRGKECEPCSEAGDATTIVIVAICGIVAFVVVAVALGVVLNRRAKAALMEAMSCASGGSIATETSRRQMAVDNTSRRGRLHDLAGRMGVKARILISMVQVLTQVTTTYDITFPDLYEEILSRFEALNLDASILPFGCLFPDLDNYMFDLVLRTASPLCAPHDGHGFETLPFYPSPSKNCPLLVRATRWADLILLFLLRGVLHSGGARVADDKPIPEGPQRAAGGSRRCGQAGESHYFGLVEGHHLLHGIHHIPWRIDRHLHVLHEGDVRRAGRGRRDCDAL
jgi:hypothetical protein